MVNEGLQTLHIVKAVFVAHHHVRRMPRRQRPLQHQCHVGCLPAGPTENYPSERQAAAMRSVDGTTQAAKAASLEKGMEASFVFATADRAAAMLKVSMHVHHPASHAASCY